jgi:hypothetical protein
MGFYFRKSLKLGLVRLNFSKSGIGTSVGITGFRIGVGPKGSYVHAGRGGLYYRKSLSPASQSPKLDAPKPYLQQTEIQEIESADVSQMRDEGSSELLQELNRVQKRTALFPVLLIFGVLFSFIFLSAPGISIYLIPYAIMVCVGLFFAWRADQRYGNVSLTFELEPETHERYQKLKVGFEQLQQCQGVWNIHASGQNFDYKRQAGAQTIIKRKRITPRFSRPQRVRCNIDVPTLRAGVETLYFFPDRILVYSRTGVGTIAYADISADATSTRFIEDGSVPGDAEVVGYAWQYVKVNR